MLTQYIQLALSLAHYEILADDNSVYAEIPGLPGVWANAKTVELCRAELQSVLEEWIVRQLKKGTDLPGISSSQNELHLHHVAA